MRSTVGTPMKVSSASICRDVYCQRVIPLAQVYGDIYRCVTLTNIGNHVLLSSSKRFVHNKSFEVIVPWRGFLQTIVLTNWADPPDLENNGQHHLMSIPHHEWEGTRSEFSEFRIVFPEWFNFVEMAAQRRRHSQLVMEQAMKEVEKREMIRKNNEKPVFLRKYQRNRKRKTDPNFYNPDLVRSIEDVTQESREAEIMSQNNYRRPVFPFNFLLIPCLLPCRLLPTFILLMAMINYRQNHLSFLAKN
eukprot:TRINITY_DN3171_c1_g1_i6.p1 TRINITY_DN3171_c1_g1~~TRINITY_DN3171_c1_g1_i6.p1  ORF type:complete len:247 (-),score=28.87 TRINITY_DN3171_c1_g1_i6:698-1438(-)